MTTAPETKPLTIALVGNPNTGKSTLFNALAGVRQRVGNYPGVTVEKKIGRMPLAGQEATIIDLPGTYSLAPRSPDEMVAVDVLLGRQGGVHTPDVVLCILDASNLERNLYLLSQVLEMGLPTVVALNMIDVATDSGMQIDVAALSDRLGVPVIPLEAHRKRGLAELKQALTEIPTRPREKIISPFPPAFQQEVAALSETLSAGETESLPRYLAERLLLDTSGYLETAHLTESAGREELHQQLVAARERLGEAGLPVPAVEAMSRYQWVAGILEGLIQRPTERRVTPSDRLDKYLTHWLLGSVVFLLMMVVVFQSIFSLAPVAMDAIEAGQGALSEWVEASMAPGALRSLVNDGIIAGVGGVLVFLPQILILFAFIAVLEDCGYMARAAYLMDKLMSPVGLSGKSFIPLLSSFACAIPGIMAARVIENPRDRLTTILVAPLMSCSARLPVYILLIETFIPAYSLLEIPLYGDYSLAIGLKAVTMVGMYLLGIVVAMLVAWLLKGTLLKGPTPPFVMELPSYKIPAFWTVLLRMSDRGWSFIKRAGTLIFAISVIVWAAGYFPRPAEIEQEIRAEHAAGRAPLVAAVEQLPQPPAGQPKSKALIAAESSLADYEAETDNEVSGAYLRQSFLGRMGQWIEPVVRPLGWDWRIGCAAIASFPAREVVIGTMGVIYNLGNETDEESESLREKLRDATWDGTDRPIYTIPVALSIMVFFALCAQCAATLVILRRETNSWRWPIFTFVYMTTLAYLGALVTYQLGTWLMS